MSRRKMSKVAGKNSDQQVVSIPLKTFWGVKFHLLTSII